MEQKAQAIAEKVDSSRLASWYWRLGAIIAISPIIAYVWTYQQRKQQR